MYCKILEEAVKELKGEEVEEEIETRINMAVAAYLPDDYVPDSSQKVTLYKKIAQIASDEENDDILEELMDRYGNPPPEVRRLLSIAEIKRLGQKLGVSEIVSSDDAVKISFDSGKARVKTDYVVKLLENQQWIKLMPPAQLMIGTKGFGQDRQLQTVKNVLRQLV
jgi:transcription-repair coupling factor (superfamily II helicase)